MSSADGPSRNAVVRCHGVDLAFRGDDLHLQLTGLTLLLAHRRTLVVPRDRVHRAFVLGRQFAISACPRFPMLGWSSIRRRIGTFGIGESAQLWLVGRRSVVVALYLRGEPYHRIVLECDEPIQLASAINKWVSRTSR